MSDFANTDTVALDDDDSALVIIDQTLLPGTFHVIRLETAQEIYTAIERLQVRGAPAIGVAAGFALYVLMKKSRAGSASSFMKELLQLKNYLNASRPTAVNLSWALGRMEQCARRSFTETGETEAAGLHSDDAAAPTDQAPDSSIQQKDTGMDDAGFAETRSRVLAAMRAEAAAIRDEDVEACRKIGEYGLTLIEDGDGILTHCNAGRLATIRYGTATAPVYLGYEQGMHFHVYCDETRPLLQGARLTALELSLAGVETTLLCDNMSSSLMKTGKVQAVFVGCDRVAANGDAANKIGTSAVAVLAKHYGIPFYICAPLTTIDMATPTGNEIVIEQRDPAEVTDLWYQERMAPDNKDFSVYNPAFDVTDHTLITAIITPRGILRAPYDRSIAEVMA